MSDDTEAGEAPRDFPIPPEAEAKGGRGMSIGDFVLRVAATNATLASAITMAKNFTHFISLKAEYKDIPAIEFFVVANGIICAYLLISLSISIYHMVKSSAKCTRMILLIGDTVMLALLIAGASAATAIVQLAHKGNTRANWNAICQQPNSFCERSIGSLVGSFIAALMMLLLVIFSALAIA